MIFANTNPNNSGNWTANYIYNRDDGSWYQCATGSKSINGKSWSDIKYDLENEKTYNGSPSGVKVDKVFRGLPDGTERRPAKEGCAPLFCVAKNGGILFPRHQRGPPFWYLL